MSRDKWNLWLRFIKIITQEGHVCKFDFKGTTTEEGPRIDRHDPHDEIK